MCGTGGDASGTFNISTTATFVVAAAGVPVAKHGNRSMTSKSGSADVLSELGINIALEPKLVSKCIKDIGIGFMFAPSLHPAMKYAMGARTALGVRTVFNILGPLCNPAGVNRQLMGVFDGGLTEQIAEVLKKLGSVRAMVVHGNDGLDEISNSASSQISHLQEDGSIKKMNFIPGDYGFELSDHSELKGGDPKENAEISMNILKNNERGKKTDIVIINAAAGILVGGKAENMKDAIEMAKDMIISGAALQKLNELASVH